MGISGLLKGLACYTHKGCNVRDFSGQALAVDASSWLHKSVYSVSERFVETTEAGVIDAACVQTSCQYIVKRCHELLHHAHIARIYLVMDGVRCPLKAETNRDREQRRQEYLNEARQCRRQQQQQQHTKAEDKYKMCIKIRAEFAQAVVQAVEQRLSQEQNKNNHKNNNHQRVICVWAPYEADAQLVKLCWDGLANAIVTEDSDVLLYLATCRVSYPILFKLDRDTGSCDVVSMDWLLKGSKSSTKQYLTQKASHTQMTTTPNASNKGKPSTLEIILRGLVAREERRPGAGVRQFVQACVLAGCDYAPSCLNGIGLVTAFKLVRDQAHRPPSDCFRHVLSSLPKTAFGTTVNRDNYEQLLSKSEAVFYYHPVVDPKGRVDHLVLPQQPPTDSNDDDAVMQVDGVTEFLPSLTRFADVSFLGTLQPVAMPNRSATNNPVPIVSNHDNNNHHHHKRHAFEIQQPQQSWMKPLTLAARIHPPKTIVATASAAVFVVKKALFNPYLVAKRPRPAQVGHVKEADNAKAPPSKKRNHTNGKNSNPFAKFSLEKENVQPLPTSNLSLMFQNNSQDVRFVKRQFPKVGRDEPVVVGEQTELADSMPTSDITSRRRRQPAKSDIATNTSSLAPPCCENQNKCSPDDLSEIDEEAVVPREPSRIVHERVPTTTRAVATTSKFFQQIPRRVTLDSIAIPQSQCDTSLPGGGMDSQDDDVDVFSSVHPKEVESIEPADSFDYGSPSWHATGFQDASATALFDKSSERPSSTEPRHHLAEIASPIENSSAIYNHSGESGSKRRSSLLSNRTKLPMLSGTPKLLLLRQRKSVGGLLSSQPRTTKTPRLPKRKTSPATSSNRKQSTQHNHFPLVIQD